MLDEVRFALRSLLRSPGIAGVTLILLTVGLALNTAAFSVIQTLVRQPVSFERCDRLAMIWSVDNRSGTAGGVSLADYLDWRSQSRVFESAGALRHHEFRLDLGSGAETITGALATPSALDALRWRPMLGRPLAASDTGRLNERGVLVNERFWRERLGGSPDIVGSTLKLDGEVVRVIGVLPRISRSYYASYAIWAPVDETAAADRGARHFQVVARLRDSATFDQAKAELSAIAARLASDYPQTNAGRTAIVVPIARGMAHVLPLYLLLLAAVGMLLLIVCANMANLQLARAAARRKEIAVRAALGAGRWRIAREMSWESVLLALAAGALAPLLATWLRDLAAASIPEVAELRIDLLVLAFTLGLSLATGVVFGLAPALAASKTDVNEVLKGSGGALGSRFARRLRGGLIAGELAVATMLLVGAGLLLKSALRLRDADPGFRTQNILTARISLPPGDYRQPERRVGFASRLRERAAALPGVVSAEVVSELPVFGGSAAYRIEADGGRVVNTALSYRAVGHDYLRQFGIPLTAGREFTTADRGSSLPVAIVNEHLASQLFSNGGAAGKRLRLGTGTWLTVVGVARNVKHFDPTRPVVAEVLVPYAQDPVPAFVLTLRTAVPPESLAPAVRQEIRSADRDAAIGQIRSLDGLIADAFGSAPLIAGGMAGFACAALLLATLGLYGLVSHLVAQRTREIGIRIALGASPRQIARLVLGHGLQLAGMGVLAGAAGAFALSRALAGLLFGVSPLDAWIFLSVALLLAAVELAASWLPARRLAGIEPAQALRCE